MLFGLFGKKERSSQPQPQPNWIRYQSQLSPEYYCTIHEWPHQDSSTCPFCVDDYNAEMRAKIYPPGINKSNAHLYNVKDWITIAHINKRMESGEITKEEAYAKKKAYIESNKGPLGRAKLREERCRMEQEKLERRRAYNQL